MTILDRSIQTSSRNWLLGFGAIVVAATALTLVLTGSSTDTHYSQPRVDLGNAHIPDERQHEDPETWAVIELREWLAKRYIFPSDDVSKEELVRLVETYRGHH